jgi:hypothetical protein
MQDKQNCSHVFCSGGGCSNFDKEYLAEVKAELYAFLYKKIK